MITTSRLSVICRLPWQRKSSCGSFLKFFFIKLKLLKIEYINMSSTCVFSFFRARSVMTAWWRRSVHPASGVRCLARWNVVRFPSPWSTPGRRTDHEPVLNKDKHCVVLNVHIYIRLVFITVFNRIIILLLWISLTCVAHLSLFFFFFSRVIIIGVKIKCRTALFWVCNSFGFENINQHRIINTVSKIISKSNNAHIVIAQILTPSRQWGKIL